MKLEDMWTRSDPPTSAVVPPMPKGVIEDAGDGAGREEGYSFALRSIIIGRHPTIVSARGPVPLRSPPVPVVVVPADVDSRIARVT